MAFEELTQREKKFKVDLDAIHARRQAMEEIAQLNLVPRIQELDGTLSMLVHLYNASEDQVMGYSATSLMKIMLNHIHELARDCLKITHEMVGIDADTSPLG